jgi:hypothetical protein
MTAKEELLARAARQYNGFEAAIHGLNEDQLSEIWLGTWSIRDIVAHLSGWHREMGPALERLARGERPFPSGTSHDDADAWNAKFASAKKDWPLDEILLDLDRSHEYFMRLAAAVPEDRLEPGRTAHRIIEAVAVHHYEEHGAEILAWRQRRGI